MYNNDDHDDPPIYGNPTLNQNQARHAPRQEA